MNNKTITRDEKFGINLYVLELQNGKYYVGITNNPNSRFRTHRSGKSSYFITKNLPIIKIHKIRLKTKDRYKALRIETGKTIELIQEYGVANVCGGAITGDLLDRMIKYRIYYNQLMNCM